MPDLTARPARVDTRRVEPTRDAAPVNQEETAKAEREASAPPGSTPGAVLALQRSIGNRGVVALLRETDPRLTYTQAAIDEGKGLDAQKLPWNSPGQQNAGWNSEEILSKLTQVDESGVTFTDPVRCGANAVLAVAITRGPFATEVFARGVMLKALAQAEDKSLAAARRQTERDAYDKIWPAIRGVGNGTATYGDLSLIAHYAKVAMSEKADSSTTGHEVAAMAKLLGGMRESGEPIQDKEHFAMFARSLKKGESYIILAGTNVLAPGVMTRNLSQVNHYVVLGRDANGKTFLYDPYPRVGTQLLRQGDPASGRCSRPRTGAGRPATSSCAPTSEHRPGRTVRSCGRVSVRGLPRGS